MLSDDGVVHSNLDQSYILHFSKDGGVISQNSFKSLSKRQAIIDYMYSSPEIVHNTRPLNKGDDN